MSLKIKKRFYNTVKFKITLWYAVLFASASAVVFFIVYYALSAGMIRRIDEELLTFSREFEHTIKWSSTKENPLEFIEEEFINEANDEGANRVFFILISQDGQIVISSDLKTWKGITRKPKILKKFAKKEKFVTLHFSPQRGDDVRLYSKPFEGENTLIIGKSLTKEESLLKIYSIVFISVFGFLLVLGSIFGWLIARRAMSGVSRVTDTAISIGNRDFSRKVPIGKEGEEIKLLVIAFNSMLEKIQSLIFELKEVSDNIAHDLRTPLTRIRGLLEVTINSNPSSRDYQDMTGEIAEECDRLIQIINTMLEITQTDSGVLALPKSDVDIILISKKAYELFLPLAEDKNIDFQFSVPEMPLILNCDQLRLERVISNILDNALKYTQSDGKIFLSVYKENDNIVISVKDTGCGISQEDQRHIFERFYRCDSSRSQSGNGLGLSLAKSVIKAHNGSISVESDPDSGSEFKIILPSKQRFENG